MKRSNLSLQNVWKKDLAKVRSWQAVGRNYATRKDGKPFADPVKALQGVDGIEKMGDTGVAKFIVNSEGFVLDIMNKTLAEIEDAIEREIENAKKDYLYYKSLLSYLQKVCEQCDDLIKAIFAAYDTEVKKEVGDIYISEFANGFAKYAVKSYFTHTFDEEALRTFRKEVYHKGKRRKRRIYYDI